MRWLDTTPKHGTIRMITKFLFLPLTINGETRWLEVANIRQTFYRTRDDWNGKGTGFWYNAEWISEE